MVLDLGEKVLRASAVLVEATRAATVILARGCDGESTFGPWGDAVRLLRATLRFLGAELRPPGLAFAPRSQISAEKNLWSGSETATGGARSKRAP